MNKMKTALTLFAGILVTGLLLFSAQREGSGTGNSRESAGLPPQFEQVIARGQIPAILNPEFVPAAAAEISEDTWVLGVHLDGMARAYSLNLLNHHEIVNDQIGEQPIAAVW